MKRSRSLVRRPRRTLRQGGALVVATAALLAIAAPGKATGYVIQAVNYEYVAPGGGSSLTVNAGDQVVWQASGDPHTVTSGSPGAIDDRFPDHPAAEGFLASGDSFSTTFTSPGTYPYFCEVHFETMTGTIIVVGAATPAPSPAPTPVPTARATPRLTAPPSVAPIPAPTPRPTPAVTRAPVANATTGPSPSPSRTPTPSGTGVETPDPSGGAGKPTSNGGPGSLPIALVGLLVAGAIGGGALLARRRGAAAR